MIRFFKIAIVRRAGADTRFLMNGCSTTLSVIATIIIAAAGVFISWLQWSLNRQKLRLDLYDRRAKIYEDVKNFIHIAAGEDLPEEELNRFRLCSWQADFLFDPEIPAYLYQLALHGDLLSGHNRRIREINTRDFDVKTHRYHDALAREVDNEVHWFLRQLDQVTEKFHKYLSMQV